jgi:hypothetical protein
MSRLLKHATFTSKEQTMTITEPARGEEFERQTIGRREIESLGKDVFEQLETLKNVKEVIPEELSSFEGLEKFRSGTKPKLEMEVKFEMVKLSNEVQRCLTQKDKLSQEITAAIVKGKEKKEVVAMIFEQMDLQNKIRLLNQKRTDHLNYQLSLDLLEVFTDLSQTYDSYQSVSSKFVEEAKLYLPKTEPDTLTNASLTYDLFYDANHRFAIDKEPVHDYQALEYPIDDQNALREFANRKYQYLKDSLLK